MRQRLFRHIVLMTLALLWAVGAGVAEASATLPAADYAVPAEQQVGQFDTQNRDLCRLLMENLSSDHAPSSCAHATGRVLLPVVRLNPHLKFTAGMLSRMPEPAPAYVQQGAVQQRSVAWLRAALDQKGYYVFALRKIII